jgi:hypothetical protein
LGRTAPSPRAAAPNPPAPTGQVHQRSGRHASVLPTPGKPDQAARRASRFEPAEPVAWYGVPPRHTITAVYPGLVGCTHVSSIASQAYCVRVVRAMLVDCWTAVSLSVAFAGRAGGGGTSPGLPCRPARYPRAMWEAAPSAWERVMRAKLREIDAHRRAINVHTSTAAHFESTGRFGCRRGPAPLRKGDQSAVGVRAVSL